MELNCRLSGRCFIYVSQKLILPVSAGFFCAIYNREKSKIVGYYVLCFMFYRIRFI